MCDHHDHDHTANGACTFIDADIAAAILRGLGDYETPIVGWALVVIHDTDEGLPPVTVIGHKGEPDALCTMFALGTIGVNEVEFERAKARNEVALDVDRTFTELAEKMRAEPSERNYDGNE